MENKKKIVQNVMPHVELRDWFAGQALPAILGVMTTYEKDAENSYRIADEMLAAREKPNV